MSRNVAVIGAGASGITAAITAARHGAVVYLYEHTDSIANKILITGNGKCNYTNTDISREHYHSGTDSDGIISSVLSRFGSKECVRFFEELGVVCRERRGGIYPYTDTAESVRTALKLELERLGVPVTCGCRNISVAVNSDGTVIVKSDMFPEGRIYDAVIISCGGSAAKKTGSDGSGYDIVRGLGAVTTDIYPALTPLRLTEDMSALTGVRCEAALKLINEKGEVIEASSGELQPFDKGLSGICALDISGNACRRIGAGEKAYVEVDYYPAADDTLFHTLIEDRVRKYPERKLSEILVGLFPKKLINYLVHPIDTRKQSFINDLRDNVKHHRYEVSQDIISDMSRAQTTVGGTALTEIDDNCRLKVQKNIYITGELLDADGVCGGYNLHFAWATGYIAGMCAAGGST